MKKTLYLLLAIVLLVALSAGAQKKRPARKKARTTRVQDKRVYLVHADVLHFDQYKNPDATILNGKVHFTHVGARLYKNYGKRFNF